jgi:hypothetical protein
LAAQADIQRAAGVAFREEVKLGAAAAAAAEARAKTAEGNAAAAKVGGVAIPTQ